MAEDNTRLQILHEHYNNTCENVQAQIRTRDKLFLMLLMFVAVMLFEMAFPFVATEELGLLIKKEVGLSRPIDASFLNSLLWFCILYVGVRYYQAMVYVERQYEYLHKLEETLNTLIGFKDITREGKSYLKHYPSFLNWTHLLYTVVFPILLSGLLTARMRAELRDATAFKLQVAVDFVLFMGCVISILLYMRFVHLKR